MQKNKIKKDILKKSRFNVKLKYRKSRSTKNKTEAKIPSYSFYSSTNLSLKFAKIFFQFISTHFPRTYAVSEIAI